MFIGIFANAMTSKFEAPMDTTVVFGRGSHDFDFFQPKIVRFGKFVRETKLVLRLLSSQVLQPHTPKCDNSWQKKPNFSGFMRPTTHAQGLSNLHV